MPYTKLEDLKDKIIELWESKQYNTIADLTRYVIAQYGDFGKEQDSLRRSISRIIHDSEPDKELIVENVRLAKDKQKLQDVQRIERKAFREQARIENAISEVGRTLVDTYRKYGDKLSKSININSLNIDTTISGVGVIHLSDLHTNELIDLPHNQYNYDVFSRRLKKYINESLSYFKYKNVSKVLVALCGDLINSPRRLDEYMNQSTNRSKAAALTTHILTQAFIEIRNSGYHVDIVSVLGNESRVPYELGYSDEVLSDNYDFTIVSGCKQIIEFSGIDGIKFHSIDRVELVVDVDSQKWLIAHDMQQSSSKQDKTQSLFGRYALRGVNLDFMLAGHIHCTRITDLSARTSSMAGSNTYNENALNLIGRAAGICYVVKNGERSMQYIDLQKADNNGYDYVKCMESYNIKSDSKLHNSTPIFQVVI